MNILIKNLLSGARCRKGVILFRAEQGATAIILAVLMMSTMLIIGLGISALIINQVRMTIDEGQSVLAFYAADAGAERCLSFVRNKGYGACDSGTLSNGATFSATQPSATTIRSTGAFGATNRKVELSW